MTLQGCKNCVALPSWPCTIGSITSSCLLTIKSCPDLLSCQCMLTGARDVQTVPKREEAHLMQACVGDLSQQNWVSLYSSLARREHLLRWWLPRWQLKDPPFLVWLVTLEKAIVWQVCAPGEHKNGHAQWLCGEHKDHVQDMHRQVNCIGGGPNNKTGSLWHLHCVMATL